MNAENFAQYLKNPSQLYQISYQELKSLVLQYPYCLNLHYLLLLKSKMDQHKDLNPNLEKTAAYSINRKFLYKQLKAQEQEVAEAESFTINEDFLELKDLSILEEPASNGETSDSMTMEAPIPDASTFREPPAASKPVAPIFEVPGLEEDESIAIENEVLAELESLKAAAQSNDQKEQIKEAPEVREEVLNVELSSTTEIEQVEEEVPIALEEIPTHETEPTKEEHQAPIAIEHSTPPKEKEKKKKKKHVNGKPTFTSWVEQFQSDLQSVQMSELMEAKKRDEEKRLKKLKKKAAALKEEKKRKKKSKKAKVSLIAKNSIQDNNSIASETLAKLLVAQEQYTRAIRIYERLLLQDPENEAYPAEIDRIRTLIEA